MASYIFIYLFFLVWPLPESKSIGYTTYISRGCLATGTLLGTIVLSCVPRGGGDPGGRELRPVTACPENRNSSIHGEMRAEKQGGY